MRDGTVAANPLITPRLATSSQSVAYQTFDPCFWCRLAAEWKTMNCPSSNIPASRRDPGGNDERLLRLSKRHAVLPSRHADYFQPADLRIVMATSSCCAGQDDCSLHQAHHFAEGEYVGKRWRLSSGTPGHRAREIVKRHETYFCLDQPQSTTSPVFERYVATAGPARARGMIRIVLRRLAARASPRIRSLGWALRAHVDEFKQIFLTPFFREIPHHLFFRGT